ncbi:eCIS core domain-containing protein [Kineosporia babensis]|uniref:eCIS core domain-containing protein n=1 Tax=Kineosporia babensis TaxID=499548 RepID=UPI0022AF0B7A|nr:DUF4157 domain-containing protein [Kineosporia babensis]
MTKFRAGPVHAPTADKRPPGPAPSPSRRPPGLLGLQASVGNQAVAQQIPAWSQNPPVDPLDLVRRAGSGIGSSGDEAEHEAETMAGLAAEHNVPGPSAGSAKSGQALPAGVRRSLEPLFGRSLPPVRVHHDQRAAQAAASIGARAFTIGRDMVFAAGQYSPGTRSGRALLAHELTHVMQQSRGAASGVVRRAPWGPHLIPPSPPMHRLTGLKPFRWMGAEARARFWYQAHGGSSKFSSGWSAFTELRARGEMGRQIQQFITHFRTGKGRTRRRISADPHGVPAVPGQGLLPEVRSSVLDLVEAGAAAGVDVAAHLEPDIVDFANREIYDVTTVKQAPMKRHKVAGYVKLAQLITEDYGWRAGTRIAALAPPINTPVGSGEIVTFGESDFSRWPGVIAYQAYGKKPDEKSKKKKKKEPKKKAARKQPAKKAPGKKAPVKKSPVKKQPAKKSPAKKTPEKRPGTTSAAAGGAGNYGLSIGLFSSGSGSGNAGLGISINSHGTTYGTVSAGVVYNSTGQAVGSVGAGAAANSAGMGAGTAGAGLSQDSSSASALSAGVGMSKGSTGGGVLTAGAGESKDDTGAGALTAGKGSSEGNLAAGALSAGSGHSKDNMTAGVHGKGAQSGQVGVQSGGGQGGKGQGGGSQGGAQGGGQVGGQGGGGQGGVLGDRAGGEGGQGGAQIGGQAGDQGGGSQTGVQGGDGLAGIQKDGGRSDGASDGAQPGVQGQGGQTGGAQGDRANAGAPGQHGLGVPGLTPAEADRAIEKAGELDRLLAQATPAQRKLFAAVVQPANGGDLQISGAAWVRLMLTATQGVTDQDLDYLATLHWRPGQVTAEQLRAQVQAVLKKRQAPTDATGAQKQPVRTPSVPEAKDPEGKTETEAERNQRLEALYQRARKAAGKGGPSHVRYEAPKEGTTISGTVYFTTPGKRRGSTICWTADVTGELISEPGRRGLTITNASELVSSEGQVVYEAWWTKPDLGTVYFEN